MIFAILRTEQTLSFHKVDQSICANCEKNQFYIHAEKEGDRNYEKFNVDICNNLWSDTILVQIEYFSMKLYYNETSRNLSNISYISTIDNPQWVLYLLQLQFSWTQCFQSHIPCMYLSACVRLFVCPCGVCACVCVWVWVCQK